MAERAAGDRGREREARSGDRRGRTPDPSLGNRSWRIDTPSGPVLQKLYRERSGLLVAWVRDLLIRGMGVKTPASPAARRATERRLVAAWRAAGFDVPEDRTDRHPEYGAPDVALFEFVEGTTLHDLLVRPEFRGAVRRTTLERFAADWGRRHAEALARTDASLLQEHGSVRHVIVAGPRLVTIDLEQAFLPRRDLRPLVAKEVASTLRSLWKRVGPERFDADLAAVVAGYPDPAILRAAADEYLAPRTLARRILWAADRRMRASRGGRDRAKYGPLEALRAELERVHPAGGPQREA